jgi:hypothetical protein
LRCRDSASGQNGGRSKVFAAKPREHRETNSCQGKAESKPAATVCKNDHRCTKPGCERCCLCHRLTA